MLQQHADVVGLLQRRVLVHDELHLNDKLRAEMVPVEFMKFALGLTNFE